MYLSLCFLQAFILSDHKLYNKSNSNRFSPVFQVTAPRSILASGALAITVYSLFFSEYSDNSTIAAKIDSTLIISVILSSILISGIRSEEHTSELQSRGHLVCR